MATTIRELLVRLGVKADARAVKDFDRALDSVKSGMVQATKIAVGLTAGVTAAAAAMAVSARAAADHGEMLVQQSEAYDVSTDKLQELRHVMEQFPVGAENLDRVLLKVSGSSQDLKNGLAEQQRAWTALGITWDQAKGKKPDELLGLLADGAKNAEDPMARIDAISTIFGDRLARGMLPMLMQGAEGFETLAAEAHALGLVLDESAVKKANKAKARFMLLQEVFKSIRLEIGTALVPVVLSATNRILKWVAVNREWMRAKIDEAARRIGDAFEWVEKKVETADTFVNEHVGGWGNLFTQVGKVLATAGIGFGLFKVAQFALAAKVAIGALVTGVMAATGLAFWPAVLVIGAVTAGLIAMALAVDDAITWFRGGESVLGDLLTALGLNKEAMAAVERLLTAIGAAAQSAGVLLKSLAMVVWDEVEPAFSAVWTVLQAIGAWFASELVTGWIDKMNALAGALEGAAPLMAAMGATTAAPTIGAAAAGGASTQNTTSNSFGGSSFTFNGSNLTPEQIQRMAAEEQQRLMRQALAAAAGGER